MATEKSRQDMAKTQDVVITRMLNGVSIRQWADGSWDGTAMCKADGKEWSNYYQNKSTKEYIEALEADLGIPRTTLILTLNGGNGEQGTRIHELIAYDLASWLSVKSKLTIMKWFKEAIHAYAAATGQTPSQLFFDTILLDDKRKYKGFLTKECVKEINALTLAKKLGIPRTPEMRGRIHWGGDIPNFTSRLWDRALGEHLHGEALIRKGETGAKTLSQVLIEPVCDFAAGYAYASSRKAKTFAELEEDMIAMYGDGSHCPWTENSPTVQSYARYTRAKQTGVDPRQMDFFAD